MAGIRLYSGESLIGQGLVSYRDLEKHTYQCWHATIYVTSQRVFLSTYTDIELKLSNIRGFTFGRILLFFSVCDHIWSGGGNGNRAAWTGRRCVYIYRISYKEAERLVEASGGSGIIMRERNDESSYLYRN